MEYGICVLYWKSISVWNMGFVYYIGNQYMYGILTTYMDICTISIFHIDCN